MKSGNLFSVPLFFFRRLIFKATKNHRTLSASHDVGTNMCCRSPIFLEERRNFSKPKTFPGSKYTIPKFCFEKKTLWDEDVHLCSFWWRFRYCFQKCTYLRKYANVIEYGRNALLSIAHNAPYLPGRYEDMHNPPAGGFFNKQIFENQKVDASCQSFTGKLSKKALFIFIYYSNCVF